MAESSTSRIVNLYKPKKRFLIPIHDFHVPKKLLKLFKNNKFTFKINEKFENVITKCQQTERKDSGTWINDIILDTYVNLHNQKKGMISIYSSYIWKKKPILIKGSLNRFRDFIYVDDCVNILIKSMQIKLKDSSAVFNLSFGDKYKVKDIIKLLIKASGKKKYKYRVLGNTQGDSFGFHASGKKLKKIFKLKTFNNIEYGLKCYFEWINKIPINSKLNKFHPYQITK